MLRRYPYFQRTPDLRAQKLFLQHAHSLPEELLKRGIGTGTVGGTLYCLLGRRALVAQVH
jgi:hypothetical protein